jgi:hypothetical protein
MKPLTVLILAAGYGRRMGPFSRIINKSLVPYNNRPLISHIFDQFDSATTQFVVACGHMGSQVKDYVGAVHADKCVVFVDIADYAEDHTGPATTIQHCQEYLTGAFMWVSCDTVFEFDYQDKLDHNWIAVHPVDSAVSQDYCWVTRNGEAIVDVKNKQVSGHAVDAFIGLMYCKDREYLDNLIAVKARAPHEGFGGLDLQAHTVAHWLDFGTFEKWQELTVDNPETGFAKTDELFYVDNHQVIKFNADAELAERKLTRAELNAGCMPANVRAAGQFLVYDRVPGGTMYEYASPDLMDQLLTWYQTAVWKPRWFPNIEQYCKTFYQQKTQDRLQQFRIKYPEWDEPSVINQRTVKSADEYVATIDWHYLCNTVEWRFVHGDAHWDNVIYNPADSSFTAIDWRTDFAGSNYGDVYYDLAKMSCGISCDFQKLKNNAVGYVESADGVALDIPAVDQCSLYQEKLRNCTEKMGLDWRKVQLLVPLIYLNISALHGEPYDKFLFNLARLKFAEYLDGI